MKNIRPIQGLEGKYYATEDGCIFSVKRGICLKTNYKYHGYPRLKLCGKSYFVHFLVLNSFIPKPHPELTVNHKNEIKTDNRLCNLEWMTREQNASLAAHGGERMRGEKNGKTKLTECQVRQIKQKYSQGIPSTTLAKEYEVRREYINEIIRGKTVWLHVT